MPSPAALAAALTPDKVDSLLDGAEHIFANMSAAREACDDEALKVAEVEYLNAITAIRDGICAAVREHHLGRTSLTRIFGSGTDRFARCRTLLDATEFSDANSADQRWPTCLESCAALEKVLVELGEVEPSAAAGRDKSAFGEPSSKPFAPDPSSSAKHRARDSRAESTAAPEVLPAPHAANQAPTLWTPEAPQPRSRTREARPVEDVGDGITYVGEWLGDMRDGEGVETRPDGATFTGQFLCGQAHGKGVFTQPDGATISGHWVCGLLHGHGLETHSDGTRYEGQYKYGLKSGHGTYTFEEGSVYEGQFNDDGMHGEGVYVVANGRLGGRYQGEWRANHMHGHGCFKHPDGRMYDGEYMSDRRTGWGTFVWPDGRLQKGKWIGGKLQGKDLADR
mmetsp:Transcript_66231/g.184430  ORF Transcript_66231/g.184430 Transcript_66231/m.184430 type:complete len:395 (+) Transcript_66231:130-1314(+)